MAMRVVALAILAALGAFVWYTQHRVEHPDLPKEVDQSPKYYDPEVEGVEPDAPPDIHVDVDVERQGEKAKIIFTVSETHGWYVDHIFIDFWYVEKDENGELKQIGRPLRFLLHQYLPFGGTITDYTTPQSHEFPEIDDFGTTENWQARAVSWGKVLAPEPEPD
ncbi:MAG: hypothetical protein V3W34_09670 [Phycisphaerae bacterium]